MPLQTVERWGIFEWARFADPADNPFLVELRATFANGQAVRRVDGFYDGDRCWKIRFMPEEPGEYRFVTQSTLPALDGIHGSFLCLPASEDNHGPIRAVGTHFACADGTPFYVLGTTAYTWHNRPEDVREQSLASFVCCGFNKVRMLVFPKCYVGEFGDVDASYEPPCYPFEGEPKAFRFDRPNPSYFRNLENSVRDLMISGIQADVILFHVYDGGHWGIDCGMAEEDDLFFLRYLVARLSAFRNVWWSLANEYSLFFHAQNVRSRLKTTIDGWSMLGEYIRISDPYEHLLSVHNFIYEAVFPNREWMTHVSYQSANTYSLLLDLKCRYRKPVINDEYQYEGNLRDEWGNSPAELVLFRHWQAAMAGGYASHGEAYVLNGNRKDIFWAYGGTLVGGSAQRLAFLKEIFTGCPYSQMEPDFSYADGIHTFSLHDGKGCSLTFIHRALPGKRLRYDLFESQSSRYHAIVYDVWNCTILWQGIVGPDHPFDTGDWTAIRLTRMSVE